jgi:hypothetical protein
MRVLYQSAAAAAPGVCLCSFLLTHCSNATSRCSKPLISEPRCPCLCSVTLKFLATRGGGVTPCASGEAHGASGGCKYVVWGAGLGRAGSLRAPAGWAEHVRRGLWVSFSCDLAQVTGSGGATCGVAGGMIWQTCTCCMIPSVLLGRGHPKWFLHTSCGPDIWALEGWAGASCNAS